MRQLDHVSFEPKGNDKIVIANDIAGIVNHDWYTIQVVK